MKAVRFAKFGGPEVLKYSDIPVPKPSTAEILVKIHAAALNPIDYKIREGTSFVSKQLTLPSGLGYDLAGEIVELGADAQGFKKGDLVLGFAGFRDQPCCYAEYAATKASELVIKPEALAFEPAACLPTAGLTALQALELAGLAQGETVLIHAGAGGVGHMAIQLAKLKGAHVITTASKRNHDFLAGLGADQCIDYRNEDFVEVIKENVDAVIDLVGGDVGMQSLEVLKPKGIMITVPTVTAEKVIQAAKAKNLRAVGMLKKSDMKQLAYLASLVAEKKLKIEIEKVFKLSEAVEAHKLLESRRVRGKLAFKIK